MRYIFAVLTACFVLLSMQVQAAQAAYVIEYSPGGVIDDFIDKYDALRDSGGDVVVDGECTSACTLVVGIIRPEHLCFTPGAILGVHSATEIRRVGDKVTKSFSPTGTALMWARYPKKMRDAIRARGWNGHSPHPDVIYLTNDVVLSIFRQCPV